MHRLLRMGLSIALALLLSLQCFAAGIPALYSAMEDPEEPVESVEPTAEPETTAPVVLEAQVRPADSDTTTPLYSGVTLRYQAAVFHFLLSDPEGDSALPPSGVDLDSCALFVDERPVSNIVSDAAETSLTTALTLPNGRHVLRVIACDYDGNRSETSYVVNMSAEMSELPVYTVFTDRDYAPLGGQLGITIHTSNTAYLSALNVTLKADPMAGADGFKIEPGSGFSLDEGSVLYDETRQTLSFRVRANLTLSGSRDVVTVAFDVSPDAAEGSSFTYEIPGAWAESRRNDLPDYQEGFSLAAQTLPVEAPYVLTVDDLYVGMTENAFIRVTDRSGGKPYQVQIVDAEHGFLGLTNWLGQLSVPSSMLSAPGSYVLYASGDAGRSFPVAVTVADVISDMESPLSFRAQSDPSGSKTVCWLSSLHNTVYLRWVEDISKLKNADPIAVPFERVLIGSVMAQVNRFTFSGLKPGTDCYFQISYDGVEWSAVEAFSAADFSDGTRFSLLGGLREADGSKLESALSAAAESEPQMLVQLGDLASASASADEWAERIAALDAIGSADLLMVPGPESIGRTVAAVSVQPDKPHSYEYGTVYFAVLPGKVDSSALDWLIRDASASNCIWKVLLTATPIPEADRPALEQAGIHFAFSEGAYARTPALSGGQIAASYDEANHTSLRNDGVVYIACGAPGAADVYLTAEATQDKLAIHAYSIADDGSEEMDFFTMLASSCVVDGHSFSEQSRYDRVAGTITCDRCGQSIPARESGYTGFAVVDGGSAYLERGYARTGWFTVDGKLMHAGMDARVHQTTDFSTETCTESGERMAWCAECGKSHSYGEAVPPCGHRYDSRHHCTNAHYDAEHKTIPCGWTGIDLAGLTAELSYQYGYYSGAALEPEVTIRTADGEYLNADDYAVSYENNVEIGMAEARLEGRKDYYGELVLPFEIRPCDVASIRASDIGQTQITLLWDEAPGAQRYAVYQQISSGWKRLGDTTGTSYTVSGLNPSELCSFRVRPFSTADVTGKRLDGSQDRVFWAAHYSEILEVRTEGIRFVDVPAGEWFASPVQWAVDHGITKGTDATHFSPYNDCTRGQMVTFLWRAKGSPEPTMRTSPFGDVNDPNAYYFKAVLWAVEQGITRGSSATTFSPDAPVTRGMVVTFLHRAAGGAPPQNSASPFVDVAPGQYYTQSVQWAVEQQITKGMDDTHFSPDTICTRAQIVTFLSRFMNLQ